MTSFGLILAFLLFIFNQIRTFLCGLLFVFLVENELMSQIRISRSRDHVGEKSLIFLQNNEKFFSFFTSVGLKNKNKKCISGFKNFDTGLPGVGKVK